MIRVEQIKNNRANKFMVLQRYHVGNNILNLFKKPSKLYWLDIEFETDVRSVKKNILNEVFLAKLEIILRQGVQKQKVNLRNITYDIVLVGHLNWFKLTFCFSQNLPFQKWFVEEILRFICRVLKKPYTVLNKTEKIFCLKKDKKIAYMIRERP